MIDEKNFEKNAQNKVDKRSLHNSLKVKKRKMFTIDDIELEVLNYDLKKSPKLAVKESLKIP